MRSRVGSRSAGRVLGVNHSRWREPPLGQGARRRRLRSHMWLGVLGAVANSRDCLAVRDSARICDAAGVRNLRCNCPQKRVGTTQDALAGCVCVLGRGARSHTISRKLQAAALPLRALGRGGVGMAGARVALFLTPFVWQAYLPGPVGPGPQRRGCVFVQWEQCTRGATRRELKSGERRWCWGWGTGYRSPHLVGCPSALVLLSRFLGRPRLTARGRGGPSAIWRMLGVECRWGCCAVCVSREWLHAITVCSLRPHRPAIGSHRVTIAAVTSTQIRIECRTAQPKAPDA